MSAGSIRDGEWIGILSECPRKKTLMEEGRRERASSSANDDEECTRPVEVFLGQAMGSIVVKALAFGSRC